MTARILTLVLLLAASVCLGQSQPNTEANLIGSENDESAPVARDETYWYKSREGRFKVMLPAGCPKVRVRRSGDEDAGDPFSDEPFVMTASCDMNGELGEGCSVTTYLGTSNPEGGAPGPQDIVKRVENILSQFGVEMTHQNAITRTYDDGQSVEGVDVWADDPAGKGELWVRGMLAGDVVYLMAAWNDQGGLFEDVEFQTFFNSFTPLSD